jgi:hypothetical protein
MRNNPKYIHYSSLSPYHYSMKSLLNTKKIQVLKVYGEEETLLRTILKERQNERTQNQEVISKEEERRKTLLKTLFYDWNVPERGWIQTKLVIIQSFLNLLDKLRLEMCEIHSNPPIKRPGLKTLSPAHRKTMKT